MKKAYILDACALIAYLTDVTSDHHELDVVDNAENIDFTWFR